MNGQLIDPDSIVLKPMETLFIELTKKQLVENPNTDNATETMPEKAVSGGGSFSFFFTFASFLLAVISRRVLKADKI